MQLGQRRIAPHQHTPASLRADTQQVDLELKTVAKWRKCISTRGWTQCPHPRGLTRQRILPKGHLELGDCYQMVSVKREGSRSRYGVLQ
jgi:hypothetical protein